MAERWILQFCHSHYGPFFDVARQYSALFADGRYKVLTVYLTGAASEAVRAGSGGDEVIFLGYASSAVRGLKLDAILALRKIVAGREIALIIAHRFKPIYIACLATRLPVIGVHHAFGDYDRWQRRRFVDLFKKRLALLGVSDAVRDDVRKRLAYWPLERIETLHNRLDVDKSLAAVVPRAQARDRLGLPPEVYVIGNVGRLHPDKDQETLISGFAGALPRLPAGSLLAIAGSGPLESKLKSLSNRLGVADSVRFLGQVPEARTLFSAFDLFVLSSDREPFGMVLLEAMAAGVPVMATACGGAPEIVERKDMLFELRDAQQLARLLIQFCVGYDQRTRTEIAAQGLCRLREAFSDEVARRRFFSLPMIRSALGLGELPDSSRNGIAVIDRPG